MVVIRVKISDYDIFSIFRDLFLPPLLIVNYSDPMLPAS